MNITSDGADLTFLFKSINFVIKTLAASLFTVVAGFRFLGNTFVAVSKAAYQAAQFNFKAAFEELQNGLTVTREQFETDMKIFKKIYTGTAEAGEDYGKRTGNMLNRTFGQAMIAKLDTFKKSIKGIGDAMGDVVVKGIKGMEDALVNFVMTGTLNFRNLANSIISDMVRIAIQQTITAPFTNFISGLFKNADGNAFVDGKVQKYAYGGVVNRPTFFPMANGGVGLMGEAGYPEAILPLREVVMES